MEALKSLRHFVVSSTCHYKPLNYDGMVKKRQKDIIIDCEKHIIMVW